MTDRPPQAVRPGTSSRIDTGTAPSAWILNYWLGGQHNFPGQAAPAEVTASCRVAGKPGAGEEP